MNATAKLKLQSYPLRVPASTHQKARELAHQEGISLNHFYSLAIAEKISRMDHAANFVAAPRSSAAIFQRQQPPTSPYRRLV